jgi:hypothetical protein
MPHHSGPDQADDWCQTLAGITGARGDTSQRLPTSADGMVEFGFGFVKRLRAKKCTDRTLVRSAPFYRRLLFAQTARWEGQSI